MDINSGAFWEGLGYEERRIAVQAIAEWKEEKQRKARIEELENKVMDCISELDDLDRDRLDDFIEEIRDKFECWKD